MTRIVRNIITSVLLLLLTACSDFPPEKQLKCGYLDSETSIALSYLAKAMLESKQYKVDLVELSEDDLFEAVAEGQVDFTVSAWFPVRDQEKYGALVDKLQDIGVVTSGREGLIVPNYINAGSVQELLADKDKFSRILYVLEDDEQLLKKSDQANRSYRLGFDIETEDDEDLIEVLAEAEEEKAWVMIAAFSPHPLFAKNSVKLLHDPLGVFSTRSIHTLFSKVMLNEKAAAIDELKNFQISLDELHALILKNQTVENPLKNAKKLLENSLSTSQ